jgi:hypothetical protein
MITSCSIYGHDFEVDDELFLREDNPLDVNEEQICEECAEMIRNYYTDFYKNHRN